MTCEKCSEPLYPDQVRCLGKAILCPTCYMIMLSIYGSGRKEEKKDD